MLHLDYFVLNILYVWFIIPLYCRYIHNFINMFVNVIYMFTEIFWCTSYGMFLGCTPYWESCRAYSVYIIFMPLLPSSLTCIQKIGSNISLFELVVTCIETHVLVANFSTSHIFLSIINKLCCFLILGQLLNSNPQHSKKCIQHHLYTIFEKISSFLCFIFSHTQIQCVKLITREGNLYSIFLVNRISELI